VVIAGVYVGALSRAKVAAPAPEDQEALAQRSSAC
jgi:hypothetical protein